VGSTHIHIAKGNIAKASVRAAVMKHFPDLIAAPPHDFKPLTRNGAQLAFMLFHPRINGGIAFNRSIESQQLRFHHRSISESMLRDLHHKLL
jgi:hypothetical protein